MLPNKNSWLGGPGRRLTGEKYGGARFCHVLTSPTRIIPRRNTNAPSRMVFENRNAMITARCSASRFEEDVVLVVAVGVLVSHSVVAETERRKYCTWRFGGSYLYVLVLGRGGHETCEPQVGAGSSDMGISSHSHTAVRIC